ncbi:TetR/AcrR family transcriptional regulator [Gilvimarinus sp. F26214L]|uniref:TetR/AcrR family transcriptional regulator n=1 Tax=Gilvimarinus sp. DZF01 TaxID=3461371 RepID=UPI00404543EA
MARPEVNSSQTPTLRSKLAPEDAAGTAGQIVEAFARRAQTVGIRSISMSELARELRVSTKTLYKYFRNKEDVVYELVARWENRIHRPLSSYEGGLLEILRYWVKVWVENDAQFSTAFWLDLQTDYPHLYKVYVDSLYSRMAVMKARVTPFLRQEINPDFAWSAYFILMTASAKPKTFEKIGMTRDQCVYAAFDFWVEAALDKELIVREPAFASSDPGTV